MSYFWSPIEDYESHEVLAHKELGALAEVWRERRQHLTTQQE